ncbi:MAG: DMT family transporter [Acidobacteriota bacterium]
MKPSHSQTSSGLLYLVSGAVAISFSPVWVAGATVGPDIAAFYRCLIGGVVLAIGLGVRKERLRFSSQNLRLAAAAIGFFAVDLALWHAAIGYIGPGLSTLLGNFQVFLLAAVGIVWLKEPANWRFLLSVPLALGGLFLLVGRQWAQVGGDFRFGVGLGLTVAFAYAAFTLTLRRAQSVPSALSPAANLMIVSLGVAAVMAPLAALRGETFILELDGDGTLRSGKPGLGLVADQPRLAHGSGLEGWIDSGASARPVVRLGCAAVRTPNRRTRRSRRRAHTVGDLSRHDGCPKIDVA